MAAEQCTEDTNEQAEEECTEDSNGQAEEFITVDSVMENDADENDAEEQSDEQENGALENGASDDTSKPKSTGKDQLCQRWVQKICHLGMACHSHHPAERLRTCAQFRWGECRQDDCTKLHFSSKEEYDFYKTGALPIHKGDAKETGPKCNSVPVIKTYKRKNEVKGASKFICKAWLDEDACPYHEKCESEHPKERLTTCKEYRDMVECPRGEDCTLKHFTYNEELLFYRFNKLPEHKGDVKVVGVNFAGTLSRRKADRQGKLRQLVCVAWRRKEKCTREKCLLLHPAEEDRHKYSYHTHIDISQKVCWKWRNGRCSNKECEYKHPPTKLKICQSYMKKLTCMRDTDCTHLHMTRQEEAIFYRTGEMPVHRGEPALASPDDAAKWYYGKTGNKQRDVKGRVSWMDV